MNCRSGPVAALRAVRLKTRALTTLLLVVVFFSPRQLLADETALVLLIQPLPHEERMTKSYQPLAQYIETLTGRRCTIQVPPNFPAYWNILRRNNYDLALDGPHFTDYRLHKFGFIVLAQLPDTTSYSLIMREAGRVLDPAQLVGRRIASLGLLSTGAVRLSAMFPNPVRQPVLVDVRNAEDGIDLLLDKRVEAAFLPTAIVGERPRAGIAVILTTEPVTRLILSAAPRMASDMREKIRDALLQAHQTEAGRSMLRGLGAERFEPAAEETFANQRNVLKSYWGY